MSRVNERYDLIVIGSGSAGVAAALEARAQGARTLVVESGILGGTCVNVGCVPSKAFLRAAEQQARAQQNPFRGVHTYARPADYAAVSEERSTLIAALRKAKYGDVLARAGVDLLDGSAHFLNESTLEVNEEKFVAPGFVVATGALPTLPPIKGLAEAKPWTYVEALAATELPKHLVVIGGGPIGLELAQGFIRFGSRVTVLELLPHILPTEDTAVSEALFGYLSEEGMGLRTGVSVREVTRSGTSVRIQVEENGSEEEITADQVLVATGRRPKTDALNLSAAGVEILADGSIQSNASQMSSNPRIYAAGDCAGLPQFVYVAAQSGRIAARSALGATTTLDQTAIPRVTFTDPAVASVGLTEAEAKGRYKDGVRTGLFPLTELPKALAARDTRGLIKLVIDPEDTVVGAHILAHEAGDAIEEAVLAVKFSLGYRDLVEVFHPYLTLAEGLRLAAQSVDTDVSSLSCCA